jgi:hypothetical protein
MATRLATARNFITVTSVPNDNEDEIKSSNIEIQSENTVSVSDVQQITPVALHHVNLSQVNIF